MLELTDHVSIPSGQADLADVNIACYLFVDDTHVSGEREPSVKDYLRDSDKPTLVFLHGGPGIADHNIYVSFFSQLTNVADVLMLDMRGHGASSGHDEAYQHTWNLQQWAADVVAICAQFAIEKPIVAGVSFGTWVAYQYLINFPQHPAKVIFINGEPKVDTDLRAEKYGKKATIHAKSEGVEDPESYGEQVKQIVLDLRTLACDPKATVTSAMGTGKTTAELYMEHCIPLFSTRPYTEAELALCTRKNIPLWQYFDGGEYYRFDLRGGLEELREQYDVLVAGSRASEVPVIILLAGTDDPEHPCEGAIEVGRILDNHAQLIVMEDAGDPVYRDKPKEVLALLSACMIEPRFIPSSLVQDILTGVEVTFGDSGVGRDKADTTLGY